MGKISPVSAKYIIHVNIDIKGIVDRPDVIGAIFGQTEGLLGSELELRELQRSGKIGRIEVFVETSSGKTKGHIEIPSSLDKAETSIVGAALEVIDRIGPCEAKNTVTSIEDVRVSKREYIIDRAKELLRNLMDSSLPDSQQLSDEVAHSVRVMEMQTYGKERLPCGPNVEDSEEILIVEGRADVINLLKYGIKNAIALNGTNVPETVKKLTKGKIVTVFVDGDRGGDLIIKELLTTSDIDYITKAPDGKELEEITQKEIYKALRSKVTAEQYRLEHHILENNSENNKAKTTEKPKEERNSRPSRDKPRRFEDNKKVDLSKEDKKKIKEIADELIGTRGASLLDDKLNVLGRVPLSELKTTMKAMESKVYGVVLDGSIDKDLVALARRSGVQMIVAKEIKGNLSGIKISIVLTEEL